MSRALTAGMLAALAAGTVRPALFYEGEFSSGTVRLTTAGQDVSWDSQTWTAAGSLLSISPVEEASDIRAVNFTVSLNGESAALLALNLGDARQGLPGTVWLGAFDAAGALIADPFECFSGKLDAPEIVDDAVQCQITVRYESRLIDLERPRERRYTHEDQQIDYAGDVGFEYLTALQDAVIPWGGAASTAPAAASGGSASGSLTGGSLVSSVSGATLSGSSAALSGSGGSTVTGGGGFSSGTLVNKV